MADLWADEVAPSLHRIEFGYRADITSKYGNPEKENARADGMFIYGGMGGYIEIKSARGMGWDMRGWRNDQREWYDKWCVKQNIPLWIWLFMGGSSDRTGIRLDPKKDQYPRQAWLVPASVMLQIHVTCIERAEQHTLPYHARPTINRIMQDEHLDAMTLLKDYELKWLGNKIWDVKPWMLLSHCAGKTQQTIRRDIQDGDSIRTASV